MKVFHFTKSRKSLDGIVADQIIKLGRNVTDHKSVRRYAHVSRRRFEAGDWAIQVAGAKVAWILDIEIPDNHPLEVDPADDSGEVYGGGWLVSRVTIPILKFHRITHIPDVVGWELRQVKELEWIDLSIT